MNFSFGKNFKDYLKRLDSERIELAKKSLKDFLEVENLKGKTFLDIGCGSGLYSLAAFNLKAKRIISFDNDKGCVECCESLKEMENNPDNWEILKGSILDERFISGLPKSDIVYSYGVLHHTGNIWEAIENSVRLISDNGCFYLAVYNKADGLFGSGNWLKIVKAYNSSFKPVTWLIKSMVIIGFLCKNMMNPSNKIKKMRGANWLTNINDKLGAYPVEYTKPHDILKFIRSRGFELVNLSTVNTIANNSYLFKKHKNI